MVTSSSPSNNEVLAEIRRELHELAVLSSALLRLATKVQTRCEELRRRMGALEPTEEDELSRQMSWIAESPPAGATQRPSDESEPAALLAMSLAGEGMSRSQIGAYLRDSFGMQDTDALLERVLPRAP
jgi:hypothetical protein